jgi:hypothetical protein
VANAKAKAKSYPLDQCPLYKMSSRKKLAEVIFNVPLGELETLGANKNNYRVFNIQQGDKERQVEVPKVVLERIHRRVFALLERLEKPEYLHSGLKGRSYITNARVHAAAVPLVKLDIKKFYPNVQGARVARFFTDVMKCSPDVAGLLTNLCTYNNHVPTGSPVSQLLSYYAAKPMFDELALLGKGDGVRMTCYVDDLTFSGPSVAPAYLWKVKQVIHRHGFKYHKERCYAANDKKLVTGVLIHGKRTLMQPSKELKLWRDISALGNAAPAERLTAVINLIGTAIAAGQIESRFLRRLRRLRLEKSAAMMEIAAGL